MIFNLKYNSKLWNDATAWINKEKSKNTSLKLIRTLNPANDLKKKNHKPTSLRLNISRFCCSNGHYTEKVVWIACERSCVWSNIIIIFFFFKAESTWVGHQKDGVITRATDGQCVRSGPLGGWPTSKPNTTRKPHVPYTHLSATGGNP